MAGVNSAVAVKGWEGPVGGDGVVPARLSDYVVGAAAHHWPKSLGQGRNRLLFLLKAGGS